jgi:uncharacterized protein with GYD domain
MIFISLVKLREKADKKMIAKADEIFKELSKERIKIVSRYWTLGRYDVVITFEAPDEKVAMKVGIAIADAAHAETLVAIPREEAVRLLT